MSNLLNKRRFYYAAKALLICLSVLLVVALPVLLVRDLRSIAAMVLGTCAVITLLAVSTTYYFGDWRRRHIYEFGTAVRARVTSVREIRIENPDPTYTMTIPEHVYWTFPYGDMTFEGRVPTARLRNCTVGDDIWCLVDPGNMKDSRPWALFADFHGEGSR